jgi:hypothetical protein
MSPWPFVIAMAVLGCCLGAAAVVVGKILEEAADRAEEDRQ